MFTRSKEQDHGSAAINAPVWPGIREGHRPPQSTLIYLRPRLFGLRGCAHVWGASAEQNQLPMQMRIAICRSAPGYFRAIGQALKGAFGVSGRSTPAGVGAPQRLRTDMRMHMGCAM